MNLREVLQALRQARSPADVVITTMGPAREWMALGPLEPLDFVLVPSAMSQAPSLGLGLALAQPDRRIIVVNGDGSMLMNLGSLVTITAEDPPNLVILVCDNGSYEVTGAQPTPGAAPGRIGRDEIDFLAMARGAGFRSTFEFEALGEWTGRIGDVLSAKGPSFALIKVGADPDAGGPRSPGPAPERAARFMSAIQSTDDGKSRQVVG